MTRTLDQKIAEAEAKLVRLRKQERSLETGQKIILGGMVPSAAKHDDRIRRWVLEEGAKLTREADKKRMEPLLKALSAQADSGIPSHGRNLHSAWLSDYRTSADMDRAARRINRKTSAILV